MVYVNGIGLAVNQTFDLNFDLEVNDRLVEMVEDLPELADYHLYKQAGNTVAVPVVSRIEKKYLVGAIARGLWFGFDYRVLFET